MAFLHLSGARVQKLAKKGGNLDFGGAIKLWFPFGLRTTTWSEAFCLQGTPNGAEHLKSKVSQNILGTCWRCCEVCDSVEHVV